MTQHTNNKRILLLAALAGAAVPGLWAAKSSSLAKEREMTATARARTDTPRTTKDGVLLSSGWVLHPAGRQIPTGDLPVAMSVSPGGGWLLVSTAGYAPCQTLAIDISNEQVQSVQTLDQTWEGMAFGAAAPGAADGASPDLFVSGGGRGLLWRFGWDERGGDLTRKAPLPVANLIGRESPYVRPKTARANAWIAGIAVHPDTGTIYALNNQRDTLYALDPATGAARAQAPTGDHPNAVALSPDHKRVFVTNQGKRICNPCTTPPR